MLKKCTLVVFAGGECFGIPAVNFPMLPEGSKLTLYLGEVVIENVEIESYHVCNKRGTVVSNASTRMSSIISHRPLNSCKNFSLKVIKDLLNTHIPKLSISTYDTYAKAGDSSASVGVFSFIKVLTSSHMVHHLYIY